jgi:DNA-binding LacI/PurR family transcriptional regulator
MWRGFLSAAEARGVDLIAIECTADAAEAQETKISERSLIEGLDLDGIIVSGIMGFTHPDEQIEAFLASLPSVPKVLIARSFAGRPAVFIDNRAGISSMVDHLVEIHGRRTIAFVAGHAHGGDAIQRHDAYREALGRHGIAYDPDLVYLPSGEYDPYVGAKAVRAIWGDAGLRPDGLVANNDDAAISAVRELARLGFDVPGEVAVTGFDDIGPCLEVRPHITTVRQPHNEIGAAALDLVLTYVGGGQPGPAPVRVAGIPVFRRSCGCSSSQAEAFSRSSLQAARQSKTREAVTARVEQALDASLASGEPDAFLDVLDAAVVEDAPEPLFELWLHRLKHLFATRLQEDAPAGPVSRLYEAALERLARATNVIERSRAAETRTSYNVLNNYFSRSTFSFGTTGSEETLIESLPQLGIQELMLCTQEDSSPVACVRRVYPEGDGTGPRAGEVGTSGHLIARFMKSRAAQGRKGPLVVMRLYHSGGDLGFVVCGVSHPDGSLYLSLQSQLSNGLKGNALLEKVQGYAHDLETKVKTLSGFLPICVSCKKIRDDKGYWNQVEAYISEHSEVEFSHGICPDCIKKLYPDMKIRGLNP